MWTEQRSRDGIVDYLLSGAETEAAGQAENQVSEEEGVPGPRNSGAQRGGSC